LIVDASKTPRKVLLRAKQILKRTRTEILGVVINKSPWPDYGDIRHYMSEVRQPKESVHMTMPSEQPSPSDAQSNGSKGDLEENAVTLTIRNQNRAEED
jgi:hypothetical protein